MKQICILLLCFSALLQAEQPERIEIIHNGQDFDLHSKIVDRVELEQSSKQLTEILASLPGIQIRRISGVGNPAQISIRGSNSQQVNVYIDGQLVNSGQSGQFDLDQLPVALIESVEINQSQSSGSGPTPIGGEIRITTVKPEDSKTTASVSVATLESIDANLKRSVQFNKHQVLISANFLDTANNYDYLVPQPFTNSQYSETQKLRNNQFRKINGFLRHDWQHQYGESEISLQLNTQSKGIPNYQNNTPENHSELSSDKWQLSIQQNVISPWQGQAPVELHASFSNLNETYRHIPSPELNDRYRYDTEQSYFSFKWPLTFNNWQWQPFISRDNQQFRSDILVNQQAPTCNGISACNIEATRQQTNVGQKIQYWHPQTQIKTSWSMTHTQSDNDNQKLQIPTDTLVTANDSYFSQEVDVQKRWQQHQIALQLSEGVRLPNMFELFGDRGAFKGNESLQEERAKGFSISAHHQWSTFTLSQSWFHQDIDNAIVAIYNSSGIGSYQNVASVKINGLSLDLTWQPNPQWQLGAAIDYLDSNTESPFRAFDNKHQPGIYHQELAAFVRWQMNDNWWFKLDHYIGADLYYDRANKITSNNGLTSEQHTTGLVAYGDFENYAVNIRISNLFDDTYQDLSNRPALGRQIQVTFTFKEF